MFKYNYKRKNKGYKKLNYKKNMLEFQKREKSLIIKELY